MRFLPLPAALVVLAWILAAPAHGATTCGLFTPGPAESHKLGDSGLVARDPYGGTLPRNRLYFSFSVKGPTSGITSASWAVDGRVLRTDTTAPFQWSAPSTSSALPAGDHTITVSIAPASGDAVSTSFPLTATDCQPIAFDAQLPRRRHSGKALFDVSSALESDGVPLTSVGLLSAGNVFTALPSSVRGARVGTLVVDSHELALVAPKHGGVLLKRDGLRVSFDPQGRRFMLISGLPDGTQHIAVRLTRLMVAVGRSCDSYSVRGVLTAVGSSASASSGGRYAC